MSKTPETCPICENAAPSVTYRVLGGAGPHGFGRACDECALTSEHVARALPQQLADYERGSVEQRLRTLIFQV